ncbi:MAG TPA: NrfD/PsrC family molybdoenzyme membrane anchor subunit [Candidatus Binatus sp.]|uniref:NrfD/PsrC family molybdoenzyme membrane anchor subunit n=1 Tax=Candidatus Binatus sp. TaxID=2811406 RepID=UPI002F42325A
MSTNLQMARRERAVMKPQPVESVAGTTMRAVAGAMIVIGAIAFGLALMRGGAAIAWEAYLVNLLFFLGVAQGAVVASAAFYLTQAKWGGSTPYRLGEAFAPFLWVGFFLFFGLYFGRSLIFPWVTHPIPQKAAWLNIPFLFARDGIGLGVIAAASFAFIRVSRGDDAQAWTIATDDIELPPHSIRFWAPLVAVLFAVVYTLISFDLVMSLAPVWRSTLFGWYFFAGAFWSGLTAMALVATVMRGRLGDHNLFTNPTVMHDFGKMVFAFSVFWIYLMFAQYIVIWYGDLPVETFFIVQRVHHMPWSPLSVACLVLIWMIPFVVLMSVRTKKSPAILGTVSALGLIGIWLERYVLVIPSLSLDAIPFGPTQFLISIGFVGAFLICAVPGLNRVAQAATSGEPVGDDAE